MCTVLAWACSMAWACAARPGGAICRRGRRGKRVRIVKQMRQERSGLERTCLEHARYEAKAGHDVAIREPQGRLLWGQDFEPDVVTIHSQMSPEFYHDKAAKIFLCHGEPLSSVGNGVSFKAILDLAPLM